MSDCSGLWGKIFGHKFKEFEVSREEVPPNVEGLKFEGSTAGVLAIMGRLAKITVKKVVRCRRCGEEAK